MTDSAVRIVNALADRGELGGVVDLGDARSWANGLGRSYRHLFWCATPQASRRQALLAPIVIGPRFSFVHDGDHVGTTRRRSPARPFDTVFVAHEDLRQELAGRGLGSRVVVASPWVALPSVAATLPGAESEGPRVDGCRIVVEVSSGSRGDGLKMAVEAVRWLRDQGRRQATLTVLGSAPELASAGAPDWIRADGPVLDHFVPGVLAEHDVLLRPSDTEGDPLLVRDALHAGLRVVASDVVPRPAGVELAEGRAEAFARAVIDGGRRSDGRGTGPPLLDLL